MLCAIDFEKLVWRIQLWVLDLKDGADPVVVRTRISRWFRLGLDVGQAVLEAPGPARNGTIVTLLLPCVKNH